MTESAILPEGVCLSDLDAGSVIAVETRHHHYRIEYLGGDKARISGHPQLCPRPILAHIQGSIGQSIQSGFIGQGMHLVFQPLDNPRPVTTSEITDIKVTDQRDTAARRSWRV